MRLAAPPALVACGGGSTPQATPAQATPAQATPGQATQEQATPATQRLVRPHAVAQQSLANAEPADAAPELSCKEIIGNAVDAKLGKDDSKQGRSWFDPDNARIVTDEAAVACCSELLPRDWDRIQEFRDMKCCMVAVNDNGYCTPWGPPMPTAMVS